MDHYDYIITGSGAAGLSLLVHLINTGKFTGKHILLIDREPKDKNDRTWCFWEKGEGLFEPVVFKRWNSVWFHDKEDSVLHELFPYQYKLIRGIDFYHYCFGIISSQSNIRIEYGRVESCVSDDSGTYVMLDGRKISAGYIFNSILFDKPRIDSKHRLLLQHFKGWTIETVTPVFDESRATLMDFRVEQNNEDTTFVYVMPFSETRALVEFTVFGQYLLREEVYEQALRHYCGEYLHISKYTIMEKESGVIPMTDYRFAKKINNIINIGTAGGQTKPSSGYTFNFIQKNSKTITDALVKTGKPFIREPVFNRRFALYDHTLLNILADHSFPGWQIFSILMGSNKMSEVMKFLDNETSLAEELKIIRNLPKGIFLRAALQ